MALVNLCWKSLRMRAAPLTTLRTDLLSLLTKALRTHLNATTSSSSNNTTVVERHLKLIRFYLPALKDFVAPHGIIYIHNDTKNTKKNEFF